MAKLTTPKTFGQLVGFGLVEGLKIEHQQDTNQFVIERWPSRYFNCRISMQGVGVSRGRWYFEVDLQDPSGGGRGRPVVGWVTEGRDEEMVRSNWDAKVHEAGWSWYVPWQALRHGNKWLRWPKNKSNGR
jgi:hypothetical protein